MIIENYETILACIDLGMGSVVLLISIIKRYDYKDKLDLTKLESKTTNFSTCLVCRKNYIPIKVGYMKKDGVKVWDILVLFLIIKLMR